MVELKVKICLFYYLDIIGGFVSGGVIIFVGFIVFVLVLINRFVFYIVSIILV